MRGHKGKVQTAPFGKWDNTTHLIWLSQHCTALWRTGETFWFNSNKWLGAQNQTTKPKTRGLTSNRQEFRRVFTIGRRWFSTTARGFDLFALLVCLSGLFWRDFPLNPMSDSLVLHQFCFSNIHIFLNSHCNSCLIEINTLFWGDWQLPFSKREEACPYFDSHLCVTHTLWLRHLVGEVRLLEACGTHALVHRGIRARRWVRWVEACLDQGFACFTCDHGLEFAGSESVDVARFTGHKQQDLGSCQGREFIGLGDRKKKMSTVDGLIIRLEIKSTDTFTVCLKRYKIHAWKYRK